MRWSAIASLRSRVVQAGPLAMISARQAWSYPLRCWLTHQYSHGMRALRPDTCLKSRLTSSTPVASGAFSAGTRTGCIASAPQIRQIGLISMSAASGSAESSPDGDQQWWEQLRQTSIHGPDGEAGPDLTSERSSVAEDIMGKTGFSQLENMEKLERQRVWDAMRGSAWIRYQKGEMPAWFDPDWLMQEEAPLNRMLRLEGNEGYQSDNSWMGGGGGGDGGSGGGGSGGSGGGGGGPWREDDPYWPLRDWGDHPMRWWTLAFAALLAVGGVVGHAAHGCPESLIVGGVSAAALGTCAMAMSDVTDWGHGRLAVKAAWAICASLAVKEYFFGWQHRPVPNIMSEWPWKGIARRGPAPDSTSHLGASGVACVAMCLAYMGTDMSGLDEWALPTNPGAVYKSGDVAYKHRVWQSWGFGKAAMRT